MNCAQLRTAKYLRRRGGSGPGAPLPRQATELLGARENKSRSLDAAEVGGAASAAEPARMLTREDRNSRRREYILQYVEDKDLR